jgi:rsbT co-antagonist protein RsbR
VPDQPKAVEQAMMRTLGLTEQTIERRRKYVGLGPDDVTWLASIRELITNNANRLVDAFFNYLAGFEEARVLLGYRELTEQAKQLKREHIIAMVNSDLGFGYVEQRLKLGLLFGRVGLELRLFLGAYHALLRTAGAMIVEAQRSIDPFLSFQKVAFFDISLMVDILMSERERTIRQQTEAIKELSTPVLQLRDQLLLLPIIGTIDTHRAQLITENLLHAVRTKRARVVVMDVTGVTTIDSRVANHLLQTVAAARLMGARVIVSGVSAEVAQSLVAIGIALDGLDTVGDLMGGVELADRILASH